MVDHENILTRKFSHENFSHENFPNYGTIKVLIGYVTKFK